MRLGLAIAALAVFASGPAVPDDGFYFRLGQPPAASPPTTDTSGPPGAGTNSPMTAALAAPPALDVTRGMAPVDLAVQGGVAPFSVSTEGALPPGIVMNGGQLSGTPTGDGTFEYAFVVEDSSTPPKVARLGPYVTTVEWPAPKVAAANPPQASAEAGTPLAPVMVSATGGKPPLRYSVLGAPPPGTSVDPSTGTFSGTPSGSGGSYSFRFAVTDSSYPAKVDETETYAMTVSVPAKTSSQIWANVSGVSVSGNFWSSGVWGCTDPLTIPTVPVAPPHFRVDPRAPRNIT